MEGKRAEVATAKATAVVRDRKFDLFDAGDTAFFFVRGVIIAHIRQGIYAVKLAPFKRGHWRILHKHFAVVKLANGATVNGILVFILHAKSFGVLAFVVFEFVIIKGCCHIVVDGILGLAKINGSAHVADFSHRNTARKQLRDAQKNVFAHTVGENIGGTVDKNRTTHLVIPIVVMGKAAQRCLKTAKDDRHVAICFADAIGIDDDSAVGAFAHLAAGRVIVKAAALFGSGVMRHHTVNIAGRYQKTEARAAVFAESVTAFVVGLREDSNAIAGCLKDAGNN